MTRIEMEAVINGGGVVLFNGKRYFTVDSLPTQEEIDAVYSTPDVGPVVVSVDAVGTTLEETNSRLPADLHADGGLKVHLQNPGDIEAGGGGGVGLTDAELRAAPVPVSAAVSNFPAVQPVSDNGGSLTTDTPQLPAALVDGGLGVTLLNPEDIAGGGGGGGLTDTELRATPVPVSGPLTDTQLRNSAVPVSVSNFPATQPVSGTVAATVADGADVAKGATTDAEATGNGSSIGILKRLRTLAGNIITLLGGGFPAALGSNGGLKVDVLSGGGGLAMGAEVQAISLTSRSTGISTSDITNTGYRGILVHFAFTAGTFSGSAINFQIEEKNPLDGTYQTIANSTTPANNTAFKGRLEVYPGLLGTAAAATGQKVNAYLPRTFRITLVNLGSQTNTSGAYYTLLP